MRDESSVYKTFERKKCCNGSQREEPGNFFIFINRWTGHDHTFTFLLSWFQFGPGTESCKLNDIKTEESKILIQDWSTRIPRLRLRFTICCWYQLFYAIKVPYGRLLLWASDIISDFEWTSLHVTLIDTHWF